ncbi:hypothetical protein HF086_001569 [Spodoptera exigua]|uniref:Uncharacterized protein n=1 Tax=Spodoptera exigua TaxID=7107 RepID=A0A922SJX8_SPOEX|nr:hypothetical protein HF086_001569 [Spodoptera exigua]
MESPHEFDFSKILDQTQYTYMSESLTSKEEFAKPLRRSVKEEKQRWVPPFKHSLEIRLRPMVVMFGVLEYHILLSTILCVYIFALSVMKIHFALLVLERDIRKLILPESRHFLLSTACVIGISTMSGSVIHFIANVTVFTYYNLKYVQPILFNCGP